MGRFGFGIGGGRPSRRRRFGRGADRLPLLAPAAGWTGTPASGFTAVPADPARTTAKPALRLMVPPNQYYTDTLVVGVYAAANDRGSLMESMGVAKVTAYFEGNSIDIAEPTYRTFPDANGKPVTYFGWWLALDHDGRHGHAHLYFEAAPRDPAMQHRVIGPFQFSPQPALHDRELTVAPSLPAIAGTRYQTLDAAVAYLKAQAAQNPRITIAEPGAYDMGFASPTYMGEGYLAIAASVPVTIRRAAFLDDGGNGAALRPRWAGLCFRGANVTIDMVNYSEIYTDGARYNWFDGCRVVNSAGVAELWRGGARPIGWVSRQSCYQTEAFFQHTCDTAYAATLARGCTYDSVRGDLFADAYCVVGNTVTGQSDKALNSEQSAFSVRYAGTGGSATLELTGYSDKTGRVFNARVDGALVGSFTVQNSAAAWAAGTNYTVRNVVDWINGLAGWSATLIDDRRRATGCSLAGLKGAAVPPTKVGSTPVTWITMFDKHDDFFQHRIGSTWLTENAVFADNLAVDLRTQNIFIGSNTPAKDFVFVNNAFWNDPVSGEYWDPAQVFSQEYNSAKSHVVIAHNSMPHQGFTMRPAMGFTGDAYCLDANNVFATMAWDGAPDARVRVADNHLLAGASAPAGATGTTIGGTATDVFVAAAKGDFTPAGALLDTMCAPCVRYDRKRRMRPSRAPAGADAD